MKNIVILLPLVGVLYTGHAQTDTQPQKTIDSVKAVQKAAQTTNQGTTTILDQDALPLQKQQNKVINENNRVDDNQRAVNGNAIDVNDGNVPGNLNPAPNPTNTRSASIPLEPSPRKSANTNNGEDAYPTSNPVKKQTTSTNKSDPSKIKTD